MYDAATGARRHLIADRRREGFDFDLATGGHKPARPFGPLGPAPTADGRYEFDGRNDGFSVVSRADGRAVADEASDGSFLRVEMWGHEDRTFVLAPRGHLAAVVVPPPRGQGGSHPPPRPVRFFDTRTWLPVATMRPAGDEWGFTGDGRHFVSYGRGRAEVVDVSRLGSFKPPPLTDDERRAAWAALALDADPAPPAPRGGGRPVRREVIDALWRLQHDPGAVAELKRRLAAPGATIWESRAVDLLERIATPEAVALLKEYAAGNPEMRLTMEARAALGRLGAP